MRAAAPLAALGLAAAASAQPDVLVDHPEDWVDFPAPQTLAQLPGPDGTVSFREAAIACNNTPGPQTIGFAIPKEQWGFSDVMAVLRIETGGVPLTDDATTVDFTTQTDFTGDTNPDGPEVGIYGVHPNWYGAPAIFISGDACVIQGLGQVWNRAAVEIAGDANRVIGCQTGKVEISEHLPDVAVGNIIGGPLPGEGNTLTNVTISCSATDNIVIGNTLKTADVSGSPYVDICPYPQRNRIGGPTPQERNVIAGFGKFGEEGFPIGDGVKIIHADETLIEGNFIGTTPDGMERVPSWTSGVRVVDSTDTTIRGNLIAGIWVEGHDHHEGEFFGNAITVDAINDDNVGVVIEGNLIGTDITGQAGILTLNGIEVGPLTYMQEPREVRIGGTAPGQGNVIAFVERTGVIVYDPSPDTEISGNSVHTNGLLGIDLGPFGGGDGVTPNDPGDGDDLLGNDGQNFPVIASAAPAGDGTRVEGTFESLPNESFRLEFFASAACDPSGFGEGEVFRGAVEVPTDGGGVAAFDAEGPGRAAPGSFATATATRLATGATSEFSACVPVSGESACPADCDLDAALTVDDFVCFQTFFALGDGSADCDQDGGLDIDDFVCFQTLFALGC